MFNLFDKDKDDLLNKTEFVNGIERLFGNCFEDNVSLVYDLFDFDGDGKVSKEDMRILLSHVPLAHLFDPTNLEMQKIDPSLNQKPGMYYSYSTNRYFFMDRLESQEELAKVLERCMGKKEVITFREFAEITERNSSTVFLCVTSFKYNSSFY